MNRLFILYQADDEILSMSLNTADGTANNIRTWTGHLLEHSFAWMDILQL